MPTYAAALSRKPLLSTHPELLRAVLPSRVLGNFAVVFSSGVKVVAADSCLGAKQTPKDLDEHEMEVHRQADAVFYACKQVVRVGAFISHTWGSARWKKALALYFYMNVELAAVAAVLAWVTIVVLALFSNGLTGMGGKTWLFPVFVGAPMMVFFLFLFFGQYVRTPIETVWLDKFCIHQTRFDIKVLGVSCLPEVVASSDRMLILWSEDYFERLWCNAEVATFVSRKGGAHDVDVVPLWFAPWLISTMSLDLIGICLASRLFVIIPQFGQYFQERFDMPPYTVNFFAQLTGISVSFWVGYAVTWLPTCINFRSKLKGHELILKQCKDFRLEDAKCSVESDKDIVRRLVENLYRHVQADPVEHFNRFVNNELCGHISTRIGNQTDIPYKFCLLVYMPLAFSSAASILGCDEMHCSLAAKVELGPNITARQQMLTNAVAWMIGIFGIYPTTFPILLVLMCACRRRFHRCGPRLQSVLDLLAVVVAYAYMGLHEGLLAGLVNLLSERLVSGHLVACVMVSIVFALYFVSLTKLNSFLFPRPVHRVISSAGSDGSDGSDDASCSFVQRGLLPNLLGRPTVLKPWRQNRSISEGLLDCSDSGGDIVSRTRTC
eukprot:TRINITY_DN2503_c0_g1_i2.p1 TRINITY_DN2503_c0_g1~~TRINITY_DN2503_c0_g1_i2.p1  ORF type:complete len:608 (+),score=88.49 TRINITY_DN2503_c0_g1_i2:177-2000(+)